MDGQFQGWSLGTGVVSFFLTSPGFDGSYCGCCNQKVNQREHSQQRKWFYLATIFCSSVQNSAHPLGFCCIEWIFVPFYRRFLQLIWSELVRMRWTCKYQWLRPKNRISNDLPITILKNIWCQARWKIPLILSNYYMYIFTKLHRQLTPFFLGQPTIEFSDTCPSPNTAPLCTSSLQTQLPRLWPLLLFFYFAQHSLRRL